jgi:hypothetical protein
LYAAGAVFPSILTTAEPGVTVMSILFGVFVLKIILSPTFTGTG